MANQLKKIFSNHKSINDAAVAVAVDEEMHNIYSKYKRSCADCQKKSCAIIAKYIDKMCVCLVHIISAIRQHVVVVAICSTRQIHSGKRYFSIQSSISDKFLYHIPSCFFFLLNASYGIYAILIADDNVKMFWFQLSISHYMVTNVKCKCNRNLCICFYFFALFYSILWNNENR